jgi:predicted RNA-binding Zn ribbon-like protein
MFFFGYNHFRRFNRHQAMEPLFIAEHPALDLLNTTPMVEGKLTDLLQSDADVLHWLAQDGFPVPAHAPSPAGSLLADARKLREVIRTLVEKRKAHKHGNPDLLNEFLARAKSYPHLVWEKSASPRLERLRKHETPRQILGPIAEAAADLLTHADFDLVRTCEDAACVLWFLDHTKSHHRRWCSMATCGNRNKVAAYRQRQSRATP